MKILIKKIQLLRLASLNFFTMALKNQLSKILLSLSMLLYNSGSINHYIVEPKNDKEVM